MADDRTPQRPVQRGWRVADRDDRTSAEAAPRADHPVGAPAPFTPRFFEEVNRGPLEEAYEAHNRDPANWTPVPWGLIGLGIFIGLLFSLVNIYAAMAVGFTVGGSFYITYFLGALMRWRPGVINYVGGASTGASQVVIGVAFVLPALFLLSDRAVPEGALYAFDVLPSPFALAGFFLVGGVYGVLFFLFYRNLWLVRRPLQYPGGFESTMELLGLAGGTGARHRAHARDNLFVVLVAALVSAGIVLLRDLRAFGPSDGRQPFLDDLFGSSFYSGGVVPDTATYRPFYNGLFFVDPFFLAIGWFIRMRVAVVLLLGALASQVVGWSADPFTASNALSTWGGARITMAAGAIVGAGLLALVRMRAVLATGMRTILDPEQGHLMRLRRPVLAALAGGLMLGIFLLVLGGVPVPGAFLAVLLGTLLIGLLGVIAVKVTGETSVQPVSPMAILALLILVGLLQLVGYDGATLAILALGTTAFFATGLVMSTDMFLDQKVALYVGNPPHRQAWAQVAGLVPGILLGTAAVWFLSGHVADAHAAVAGTDQPPDTPFGVPFGGAFAGLVGAFSGGEFDWTVFLLAAGAGAFVELATGLGTAFGIGMALQLFAPFTIFMGAGARELFERYLAAPDGERGSLARVAAPTGMFVGASVAAIVVFALNQFVF